MGKALNPVSPQSNCLSQVLKTKQKEHQKHFKKSIKWSILYDTFYYELVCCKPSRGSWREQATRAAEASAPTRPNTANYIFIRRSHRPRGYRENLLINCKIK